MVALMDRFPEFRFNHSTAQLYQWIEEDDPALFARIREKVEAGQWEPVGGMWVEPDLNMPTGESLARQLIYGQRYFERSFGRRHRVAWLPDCFGFSPGLPQLLRQAGIDSLMTIKVNWSETNRMPHDLFWWEGLDGSRVLVHTFDNPGEGYNALIEPRSTLATWRNYRGKHRHPESLLSFGFGDGGGGPTEEMLTRTRQLADFPVVPALRQVKVEDFFASAQERGADLPVWLGEIYLEYHRGTFTTQGRTKRLHRQAERALIGAEALGALAALGGGAMPAPLHETWQVLLRNQFHDILPGSSIREVHAQAEDELASVIAAADAAAERALDELAQRLAPAGDVPAVLAVNPDLRPRPIRLAAPHPLPGGQPVEGGSVLCGGEVLPGLSAALVTGGAKTGALEVAQDRLENAFLRVTFGRDGTIASLYDKQAGREVLADRGNQIWAYVDKPRDFDAWELDAAYRLDGEELRASDPPQIVERGPHRAALRIRRRFRDSEIVQEVRLWANSPRLEFATDFDWHDRRILVKALMPLAIRADHATFECAHGVLRRPTHGNTSWDAARYEGAGHRFVDLSEHGYGVALLNDGRYGHHALGGELGLTLLRAPVYPDPLADEGAQHLRYALLPHAGDWMSGGVLAEAEDFNRPLYCRPVTVAADAPRLWQGVRAGGLATALSGFKPAEAGDALVLRVYEPAGARGDVALGLPPGWRVGARLSLLEDPLPEAAPAGAAMGPFEVRTLRIERDE
jgi:alpha-mannosidase